ncbi:ABC transporter permease [Aeromicrobium sp. YIM 150415]|uniref:ABC transporter permease n=1 Tax=Aeromicrobium TaxID=2040 RepID=UPI00163DDAF5|nr:MULTISPECIES: ABC transporter permease [Aeromicrobium]MBM9463027.1 ABC transporter permease [Aeromicrobium sp. YIM 150415]
MSTPTSTSPPESARGGPVTSTKRRRISPTPWLLLIPGAVLYLLVFVVPQAGLLAQSISPDGVAVTTEHYEAVLGDRFALGIIWRSIWIAALVAAACAVLGFPLAYQLSRSTSRFKGLLVALTLFPLLTSAVIRTFGWQVIFYETGPISTFFSWFGADVTLIGSQAGVIIALTQVLLPFMVLTLQGVIRNIPVALEEAAQDLGDGPIAVFTRVLLPLSKGGLLGGSLLVFSLAISTYVTPALIGGARVQVVATTIYQQAISLVNYPRAAAFAVVLLVITGIVVLVQTRLLSGESAAARGSER